MKWQPRVIGLICTALKMYRNYCTSKLIRAYTKFNQLSIKNLRFITNILTLYLPALTFDKVLEQWKLRVSTKLGVHRLHNIILEINNNLKKYCRREQHPELSKFLQKQQQRLYLNYRSKVQSYFLYKRKYVKKGKGLWKFCNKSNFRNALYGQSVWIVFPQKNVLGFF